MKHRLITAVILAATWGATPTFALEAMRCNVQTKPGLFQPVLRIVDKGMIEDIRMGAEGLSRTIFYRDRDVLKYVAAKMGKPMTAMPSSVSGQCGAAKSDSTFQGGNGNGGVVATLTPAPAPVSAVVGPSVVAESPGDYPSDIYEGDAVY